MAPPKLPSYHPVIPFQTLVEKVAIHPYFPLLIKKVFEACKSNAFESSPLKDEFSVWESHASNVQKFAKAQGTEAAKKRYHEEEYLIASIVAGLDRLNVAESEGSESLQLALAIGRQALGINWTDPRFVGATDNHRIDGAHRTDPIPQVERTQRNNMTRDVVDITRRSDGIQRSSGIEKPVRHATKMPLPEKATMTLERWFWDHFEEPFPANAEKEQIAAAGGVSVPRVNYWFGNKRMRLRREFLKLRSPGDEPITNKVLTPLAKWKLIVVSKMHTPEGQKILSRALRRCAHFETNGKTNQGGLSRREQERVWIIRWWETRKQSAAGS